MHWWLEDCYEEEFSSSFLEVEQCGSIEDDEAQRLETVCTTATPGPLVVDDLSDGGGAVIATLADGRQIVSILGPVGDEAENLAAAEANVSLICQARGWILRLLQDRRKSRHREQMLLTKIRRLEAKLRDAPNDQESPDWAGSDQTASQPR